MFILFVCFVAMQFTGKSVKFIPFMGHLFAIVVKQHEKRENVCVFYEK